MEEKNKGELWMMKKWVALILAVLMMLGLAACGEKNEKSSEVSAVEELIRAIGEVTIESEPLIQKAQAAYDALPEAEQKNVENYAALEDANSALNQLYAQEVIDLIDAIGTVNISSSEAIIAAINSYDSLTEEQQKLVTNYSALTDAATVWTEKYNITGIYFACTLWHVTDEDYNDITKGNSTYVALLAEINDCCIQISDNYDRLVLKNQYGTYIADIKVKEKEYKQGVYYEAESVDWEETPTAIEGHEVTFSTFLFYPNTGIARLNFVLDGGENNRDFSANVASGNNPLVLFQEFEVFVP